MLFLLMHVQAPCDFGENLGRSCHRVFPFTNGTESHMIIYGFISEIRLQYFPLTLMGAANSSSDAPPFLMPLPSEVLEHLFSFLSMSDLLMAACVCNDWKREAFRMFRSQSNKVLLDQSTMVRAGGLVKIKTCIELIIALASAFKNMTIKLPGFGS